MEKLEGRVAVITGAAGGIGLGMAEALDDWRWLIGVNLWGVVHGIHAFVPILIEQDEAHVVSTASMGGLMTGAGTGPYSASKAGVIAVSKSLRAELDALRDRLATDPLPELATDSTQFCVVFIASSQMWVQITSESWPSQ